MKGSVAHRSHSLGRLDLRATVADLDTALALRPRIERMAWRMVPGVIEDVFDALDPAELTLRVERLDLGLGTVRPERLEEDMLHALSEALSEALAGAIHAARLDGGADGRLIPHPALRLEQFETYLATGALPHARRGDRLDPIVRLCELAAEQPEALVAMLRRRAHDPHVLERLVVQTGEAGLRALLALLAPADAQLILGLIADTLLAHRLTEPPVPVPEPELERLLHVATLEFLLRDAGTQFNRRRFLGFLLEREAARAGIDHDALLDLLTGAVQRMRARARFRTSLPIVLSELLAEPRAGKAPELAAAERDRERAYEAARDGDLGPLVGLMRRHRGDDFALEQLLSGLDQPLFEAIVLHLGPSHTQTIIDLIAKLTGLHRSGAFPATPKLSDTAFERMLRRVALTYLLERPGSRFTRAELLERMLRHEAERSGAAYSDLLALVDEAAHFPTGGVADARAAAIESVVQAIAAARAGNVDRLVAMLRSRAGDDDAFEALALELPPALFAPLFEALAPAAATELLADLEDLAALHAACPLLALSRAGFALMVRSLALRRLARGGRTRFDRAAMLRDLLGDAAQDSHMPLAGLRAEVARMLAASSGPSAGWRAELAVEIEALAPAGPAPPQDQDDPEEIARILADTPADVPAALRRAARRPNLLMRVAGLVTEGERPRLLAAFDPVNAEAATEELAALARLHAAAPLVALDGARFGALIWALAVDYLARLGSARFDRETFARSMRDSLARYAGTPLPPFARDERPGNDALDQAPERHARVEHYLRTGQPPSAGRGLPAVAAADPAWLAAAIRRLARQAPGSVPALLERLRAWLLPEELLECLMGGDKAGALRSAERLAGPDLSAWQAVFVALLEGKAPEFPRLPPGNHDRLALLAHWLDHGRPAWWDPAGPLGPPPWAELDGLGLAELSWLFQTDQAGRSRARLSRAVGMLSPDQASRLLDRLAPGTADAHGPLQASLAGLPPSLHAEARIQAAAATLAGAPFDLADLTAPPEAAPLLPAPARPAATDAADTADPRRLFAWLDGARAHAGEAAALTRELARLADAGDAGLLAYLQTRRSRAPARARWAALLPDEVLARIVHLLTPSGARNLLDAAMLVRLAWRQLARFGEDQPDLAEHWTEVLGLIAEPGPVDLVRAVDVMVRSLTKGRDERAAQLRQRARLLSRDGDHVAVAAALRRAPVPHEPAARAEAPRQRPPRPADTPTSEPPKAAEPGHALYVGNAGLVLFSAYLPDLFDRLGLLTHREGKPPRIVGVEATSRAVHLLQYLADGRLDRPEPRLALNKLLCGVPTAQPVARSLDPDPADLELCDGLLAAVIRNWPIIGNSSAGGLRETFLQREGRLRHRDRRWTLTVQRRGVDVLVDQIPWSFSMIFHRWMAEPVHVTW